MPRKKSSKSSKDYRSMQNKLQKMKRSDNFQDATEIAEEEKGERKFRGKLKDRAFKSNDPQWYFKDTNILRDTASFSFNTALGSNINLGLMYPDKKSPSVFTSIPGLLTMTVAPVPGISRDAQSPANIAAQNVYSFVRYKNSGASNYDAPDLMLYLLAMDSVFACWNWMKRIYGFASTYSQTNRYQPKAYMLANRVDIEDVYSNLADFRAYLNMAANRISAFCVPANMTYMVRHSWLFSNVYKDSDTLKAQEYMYVPAFFYAFDEMSSSTGGQLVPVNVMLDYDSSSPTGLLTVAKLKAMLDGIINALQYSEDIGVMSGDILKAYGEGGLFKLSTFDPDYRVEAVYSQEVLTQFENAHLFNYPQIRATSNLEKFVITQDPNTNYIVFQPTLTVGVTTRNGDYINFHWADPTPEQVIVASRINYTGYANSTGTTFTFTSCGSELGLGMDVYFYAQGTLISNPAAVNGLQNLYGKRIITSSLLVGTAMTEQQVKDTLVDVWMMNAFDWSPYWDLFIRQGAEDWVMPPIRDWDMYTFIDQTAILAMNEMALLTEFNVPN